MRVVHLSTLDRGGAFIAARRLDDGLRRMGINSELIVAWKQSANEKARAVPPTSHSMIGRMWRRIDAFRIKRQRYAYLKTEPPKLSYLNDDRVPGKYILHDNLPAAEAYNLHFVVGFVDSRYFFRNLRWGTPLVWTLHDMNPITGGCHYSLQCNRFTTKCGYCPQLGSKKQKDLSAEIYERKRAGYSAIAQQTTRIVAPSKWLKKEAERSSLMRTFDIDIIPNGVDINTFAPRSKDIVRRKWSIRDDELVAIFCADAGSLYLKGFDLLCDALSKLDIDRSVTLAIIGDEPQVYKNRTRILTLGRIEDERMMACALSIADVFVLPSRADNLPNVALEAMACGIPVVSFAVGGVADVVRSGTTGLLVPPENVIALRDAIRTILMDNDLRSRFSAESRRIAVEEYALEIVGHRYKKLYEELVETSTRVGRDRKKLMRKKLDIRSQSARDRSAKRELNLPPTARFL